MATAFKDPEEAGSQVEEVRQSLAEACQGILEEALGHLEDGSLAEEAFLAYLVAACRRALDDLPLEGEVHPCQEVASCLDLARRAYRGQDQAEVLVSENHRSLEEHLHPSN